MKKISLLFLMVFLVNTIFAQVRIGIIAGTNFTTQKWVSNSYNYEGTIAPKFVFHGGITSDIPVGDAWSIQPELYFSMQGCKISQEYNLLQTNTDINLGYAKLPVTLTYLLDLEKAFLYFGAGPYISRLGISNTTFLSNDENKKSGKLRVGLTSDDEITPWDFGLHLKTGFQLKKGIGLGVHYSYGLKDINPQLVQTYNRSVGVSLIYLFGINGGDKYNRYPDYYNY
jgi:Outer membrane protein beta-barrel domain